MAELVKLAFISHSSEINTQSINIYAMWSETKIMVFDFSEAPDYITKKHWLKKIKLLNPLRT